MYACFAIVAGVAIFIIDRVITLSNRNLGNLEVLDENDSAEYVRRKLILLFGILLALSLVFFIKELFSNRDFLFSIKSIIRSSFIDGILLFLIYRRYDWARVILILLLGVGIFMNCFTIYRLFPEPISIVGSLLVISVSTYCIYVLLVDKVIRKYLAASDVKNHSTTTR